MASSRQLKGKIRTVGNIRQITRAMEMVAATKMRKSQETALRARPFAKNAFSLLSSLFLQVKAGGFADEMGDEKGIFWRERAEGKECLLVITSDKGLCGNYNAAVLRQAWQFLGTRNDFSVVVIGKKARDFFVRRGVRPVAEFCDFSDITTLADVYPVAKRIVEGYTDKEFKSVSVVSARFVSALVQKYEMRKILPLTLEELDRMVKDIVPKIGKYAEKEKAESKKEVEHVLEPSREAIIEEVTKELLIAEFLHLVLEANASEHSSRMVAMKSATDNAKIIQEELQLQLNKARQASITQELTEISTAKEALMGE